MCAHCSNGRAAPAATPATTSGWCPNPRHSSTRCSTRCSIGCSRSRSSATRRDRQQCRAPVLGSHHVGQPRHRRRRHASPHPRRPHTLRVAACRRPSGAVWPGVGGLGAVAEAHAVGCGGGCHRGTGHARCAPCRGGCSGGRAGGFHAAAGAVVWRYPGTVACVRGRKRWCWWRCCSLDASCCCHRRRVARRRE